MYAEPAKDFGTEKDCFIYCGVNAYWEEKTLELPVIPAGMEWRIAAYTGDPEMQYTGNVCIGNIRVMPRSVMVLIGS